MIRPSFVPRALRLLAAVACLAAAAPASAQADNSAPTCWDSTSVRVDNDTTRGVSFQCGDTDNDALTYAIVDPPQHGTLSAITGTNYGGSTTYYSATYTPAHGYVGEDHFTYKANDGSADSNVATQSFDVTDPSPPVCHEPPAVTMRPQGEVGFSLYAGPGSCDGSAGNPNNFTFKFRVTKQPDHGSLEDTDSTGNTNYVTYTPEQGYSGADTFKYVAVNSGGDSNEVTQQITLDPQYNRKPACSPSQTPPLLRVGHSRTMQLSCFDPDGDPVTVSIDTTGMRGSLSAPSDDPGDAGDYFPFPGASYVTYTAPADAGDGHDQYSYTAADDRGASADAAAVQKFDVHTADYNTAPHCNGYNPYGYRVESGRSVWISGGCADDERDAITYTVLTEPSHGTVALRYEGVFAGQKFFSFTYKPTGGYTGDDSFTYQGSDDRGATSAEATIPVKVVEPLPPACYSPSQEQARTASARGLMLNCFGAGPFFQGGPPESFAITTPPAHGAVTFPDGVGKNWVVYKSEAGYEGPDSFSYKAVNAVGDSNVVTQELTVSATRNRKPSCSNISGNAAERVRSGSTRDLSLYCWDPDGDQLTYTATAPAHGTLGAVKQPSDSTHGYGLGSVPYTPDADYLGTDSFTVKASDGIAESLPVNVAVDVVTPATNRAPQCWSGMTVNVAANVSYTFGGTDFPCWDQDGDPLGQVIVTPPEHGTLSAPNSHGARTYTPTDPGWTGEDSFTFRGDDGRTTSEVAEVRIDVSEPVEVTAEPANLPSGEPVTIENYVDAGGKSVIAVPSGDVRQFPSACMPLDVDTTIASGSGSVGNAKLVLAPADGGADQQFDMTHGSGDSWSAQIDCVEAGELSVTWDFTESGTTTQLSKPLGGIVLIDPQGVVYDQARYDAAIASGKGSDEARNAAAIEGAAVELQRYVSNRWGKVVSGDPGISPNVNPQVTKGDGLFRWDVSAGTYRVVVRRPGYDTVTSQSVVIPPPVTTLNVAMTRSVVTDDGGGSGGTPGTPDTPPATKPGDTPTSPGPSNSQPSPNPGPAQTIPTPPHPSPKPACFGLKGKKKAQCESKQRLKKALAKCSKLKGRKKAICVKRARARAKCDSLKGRKKSACVRRANAIGARKP